jgi:FtsZ-binding cell division protein ZapB
MKKVILGVLVLGVVLIGGGIFYVINNLDALVKQVIETAGTYAVGSPVTVGGVSIDLRGGSATITDFAVANPRGFSNESLMSFDELSVALDLANISSELIAITSIVARNPRVHYETVECGSNLQAVPDRFSSEEPAEDTATAESNVKLQIGSVLIEDIEASMTTHLLQRSFESSLGDIRLQNLSGTPDEIAQAIMKPVISQLSRTAANALLSMTTDLLKEDLQAVGQQVVDQAQDKLDDAKESVNNQLEEAQDNVRESLGNLLNRN